jgi:ABC-type lipoprotein export system ATPase subunit
MLELQGITKTYRLGAHEVTALRDVSLTVEPGEYVAIMGPSGSGKSSLMNVLGLLDTPDSGSYRLFGREVAHHSEDELAVLRREAVGFIFQQFNLLPRLTAVENAALPLLYAQHRFDLARGAEMLRQVGLGDRLAHRPNELSGGQQQRVAIARALVNDPDLILADEPTGNLDTTSGAGIMKLLSQLHQGGRAVLVVTHDSRMNQVATRTIQLLDGQITDDTAPSSPDNPPADLSVEEKPHPSVETSIENE